MTSGFNVKNQSTDKVWQTELALQDWMYKLQSLTKRKGEWLEEGQQPGWETIHFTQRRVKRCNLRKKWTFLRLLFKVVIVINRNNSNINMKEKKKYGKTIDVFPVE